MRCGGGVVGWYRGGMEDRVEQGLYGSEARWDMGGMA